VAIDISSLRQWVGRQETLADPMPAFPAAAMAAVLDRDEAPRAGDPLPPLWHWIYFHELHKSSDLSASGHPRLGDFLPPVPLPRRMWAGGRVSFLRPLRIGEAAQRVSTVTEVSHKQGASGELMFVVVRHEISGRDGPAIVEEHDIVYREAARPGLAPPAPPRSTARAVWKREKAFDVPLLFRYSALIFNANRIHYDRPYAKEQGYEGIVVHGPLIATLLADLAHHNADAPIASFRYRLLSPLVDGVPCAFCGAPNGKSVTLWAEDGSGALIAQAEAELAAR
jgi:3-methylfumaryl-CoA hydratase